MELNNDNTQKKSAKRGFFKRSDSKETSAQTKDERLERAVKPKKIQRTRTDNTNRNGETNKDKGEKPRPQNQRQGEKPNGTRNNNRRSSNRGGMFVDKYDNSDRNERGERINVDKSGNGNRNGNRNGSDNRNRSSSGERNGNDNRRRQTNRQGADVKSEGGERQNRRGDKREQARLPFVKQEQLSYSEPKKIEYNEIDIYEGEEISKKPDGKKKRSSSKGVKIVFLGGVGEIGKNMTAIECGNDIIIIDAGAIFPTDETPGFDLIVPDISYLKENAKKIRAVFVTHGHEDHIGGIPYLLKEIKVPIVATKLTLALVDNKLREHKINDAKEVCVVPGQEVSFGCFTVKCVNVNHSIAGSLAYAITTPQGVLFHSGDYKIDLTPVAGEPIDLKTIGDIGEKGVLLYLGESTNIERAGYTMSEATVGTTIDKLFGENSKRRIIIATFASNVHRLQQIIDIAVKHKRKVALSGRSMLNVSEAAEKIGELKIPKDAIVDVAKIKNMRDDEIVVVCTGSQGEPMSALTRMSSNNYPNVQIGENDTVIVSASPIPGNEKLVYRVINNLYRLGADVVYESIQNIHVSGHACLEEHKIMHTLLKPKYFIPVHGEYRHLKKHAQLAEELGMPSSHVMIADIGNCIEVTQKGLRRLDNIQSGSRLIDGEGIEDEKQSVVVEDRRQLSEEGLFIVSIAVSGGEVVGDVAINSRGFVFDFHRDYFKEMRDVISRAIAEYNLHSGSVDELKRVIKRSLRNYLLRKTKQSPMVVPVIVEI